MKRRNNKKRWIGSDQCPDSNAIDKNPWHKLALAIFTWQLTNRRVQTESLVTAWNGVVTRDHLVKLHGALNTEMLLGSD
jgi:hypothetical protein